VTAPDSITRKCLGRLLRKHDGRDLNPRSLTPDDLRAAEEILLCGTLDEVVTVAEFDGYAPPHHELATRLFEQYRALCTPTLPDAVQTRVSW